MALSDVLKKYGDNTATEGIMFPSAGVQSVTTEQQVYDSTTDGIMTVTGQQYSLPTYTGPTATVQYGEEDAGYPRMLRQIEQGELPQFKQEDFPKIGEGVMTPSTPITQPIETTPVQPEQPAVDPCPPGYKLIGGVCQPIQQDRGNNRPTFTGPQINSSGVIDGYTGVLGRDRPTAGRYDAIKNEYGEAVADKVFEVNRTYRNRGAQLKAIDEAEKNRILNVYGEDRLNKDYVEGNNGVFYRVVATSPTLKELGQSYGEVWSNAGTKAAEAVRSIPDSIARVGKQANPFQAPEISKVVTPDSKEYFFDQNLSKDLETQKSLLDNQGGTLTTPDGNTIKAVPSQETYTKVDLTTPEGRALDAQRSGLKSQAPVQEVIDTTGPPPYDAEPIKSSVDLTQFETETPFAGTTALATAENVQTIGLKEKMIRALPDTESTVQGYLAQNLSSSLLGDAQDRQVSFSGLNTAYQMNPDILLLSTQRSNISDTGVDLETLSQQRYGENTMPLEVGAGLDLLQLDAQSGQGFGGGFPGASVRYT